MSMFDEICERFVVGEQNAQDIGWLIERVARLESRLRDCPAVIKAQIGIWAGQDIAPEHVLKHTMNNMQAWVDRALGDL